ncbi:MAG: DUF2157 domain-containing protein [Gemmatimonadetes bacterium]|nr:DUF2157 domain-containing protein [Gemmatimonadota bacterium]
MLSPEQAARILDLYPSVDEVVARKRSRAVLALMGVAALLVGLAALLLVGYNWQAMPRPFKLLVVFGAIVGTHLTALFLRYRTREQAGSEATFFLGCLFYGAGIWLVAQIFHLNAHFPDGVWWWAVGVLPFALCLDTLLLHAFLVALLGLWAGMEVLGFSHLATLFLGQWRFPNGAYTLPLLALPGLLWAYRKGSPATVSLYVPLLTWWFVLQPFSWHWGANSTYFIGAVGALLLILAETHRSDSPFEIPYRLYGVLLVGGVLVVLSFFDFNRHLLSEGAARGGLIQTGVIVALALGSLAVASLVPRDPERAARGDALARGLAGTLRRQWLPAGLLLLMVLAPLSGLLAQSPQGFHTAALLQTVLANVAMIACALWLTGIGLRDDRGRPFAAGVLYFLLWAVLRYADLFGDFGGMLGAAAMFFLCGATLFAVALYWRRRKSVRHA